MHADHVCHHPASQLCPHKVAQLRTRLLACTYRHVRLKTILMSHGHAASATILMISCKRVWHHSKSSMLPCCRSTSPEMFALQIWTSFFIQAEVWPAFCVSKNLAASNLSQWGLLYGCRLLSPLLLRQLLLWLEGNKTYGSTGGYRDGIGWLWAVLLGVSGYLSTLTHHQAFWSVIECLPNYDFVCDHDSVRDHDRNRDCDLQQSIYC